MVGHQGVSSAGAMIVNRATDFCGAYRYREFLWAIVHVGTCLSMSLRKLSLIAGSIVLAVTAAVAGLLYWSFAAAPAARVTASEFVLPNVTVITPRIERLSAPGCRSRWWPDRTNWSS